MTCFLLMFLVVFQTEPMPGVDQIQDQLQTVNGELDRLQRKLDEMKRDSDRVSDEMGKLELRRALITAQIEKHELELREADRQLQENEKRSTELRERAEVQKAWLLRRLRQLYKRGMLGYAQLFLKQARLAELINAYHYAKVLTRRDHDALARYHETIEQLHVVSETLSQIKESAQKTRDHLATQEANLKNLVALKNRRLREIRAQASKNRRLLEELELEKEELHAMVRRLVETDVDPIEIQVPVTRYRGKLLWPADGKLIRKFGVYRDPEFRTKRKQNGIHIELSKGKPIRSVYSGRVIFADWFKSYGNLVIVDHNEKIYSFYAHCDRILVEKDQFVEKDELIAYSGDTGSLVGPLLHFEIRNKTVPEDPLKWLKSNAGARKR